MGLGSLWDKHCCCVALYFIWHLAAAAVLDAVEILDMELAVQSLFPAM